MATSGGLIPGEPLTLTTEKARLSSMGAISDYANQSIQGKPARADGVSAIRSPLNQSTSGRASQPVEAEAHRPRTRTSMQTRANT